MVAPRVPPKFPYLVLLCFFRLISALKYLSTVDVVLCQGFGGYRFQTVKVDLAKEIVPELHFLPVAPQHRGLLIAILLL